MNKCINQSTINSSASHCKFLKAFAKTFFARIKIARALFLPATIRLFSSGANPPAAKL
jgi:hypothetical protein